MTVSLLDPAVFHEAVPHEEFDRLRREEPVLWTPAEFGTNTDGCWSLTRYADIAAVGRDVATFTNTLGANYPILPSETARMADNVMFNDPPRQTELRRFLGAAFTPRMVARFTDWITTQVDAIIKNLAGRGECDFVPLVAVELPAQVICSVIGVPQEERARVVAWADTIFGRLRPDIGPEKSVAAIQEVMEYALELRESVAGGTEVNMITELAKAERDGVKITDSEYRQMIMSLLIAGFETTHTLIGQGMRLILENADIEAQARAAAERGDTRQLVEEFLRFVTPAMLMVRHATRDVELHDKVIKKDESVLLWFAAANRDPAVFENPHTFDASRTPNPHQTFGGGGPHFCIGNHLARLELQILFRDLLTRGPRITLNGRPERGWSIQINQLRSLPVACE
ncbi:cytochrome P450 [Actinomadura sp. LD22]|uniref:Cytochrome P450 n=1 Tax=Actinomadura physcomitrii TaxID=2650748 RepID=A0A6I4M6H2_9ACTN|nr:cytochrome P450 [Actinomadura physcomitrii]MVZ99883.1 cytochrome P450 [Actinomadura physcomitrii]